MAAAVESPFVLNIATSNLDIPQHGGTFVAGRRRRINNDPYGGEGYLWEDITAPTELEEESSATGPIPQSEDEHSASLIFSPVEDAFSGQQSVATARLDQLKQHLIEIIRPRKAVEGFSLDNIHQGFSLDNIHQDWQSPQLHCPRYTTVYPRNPNFNHEWQSYARGVLFPNPNPQQSSDIQPISNLWLDAAGDSRAALATPGADAQNGRRRSKEISFEPCDVTCSSWSSLISHRRRHIAEIA